MLTVANHMSQEAALGFKGTSDENTLPNTLTKVYSRNGARLPSGMLRAHIRTHVLTTQGHASRHSRRSKQCTFRSPVEFMRHGLGFSPTAIAFCMVQTPTASNFHGRPRRSYVLVRCSPSSMPYLPAAFLCRRHAPPRHVKLPDRPRHNHTPNETPWDDWTQHGPSLKCYVLRRTYTHKYVNTYVRTYIRTYIQTLANAAASGARQVLPAQGRSLVIPVQRASLHRPPTGHPGGVPRRIAPPPPPPEPSQGVRRWVCVCVGGLARGRRGSDGGRAGGGYGSGYSSPSCRNLWWPILTGMTHS